MNTQRLSLAAIALSTGTLALACILQGQWPGLIGAVCIGVLWLAGILSGRSWLAGWCLTLMTLVVVLAALFAAPAILLVFSITLALIAYDLSLFQSRIAVALDEYRPALEHMHVRHLLLIAAPSLAIGELALVLRLQLSFFWLLALGIAAVLMLALVARQMSS